MLIHICFLQSIYWLYMHECNYTCAVVGGCTGSSGCCDSLEIVSLSRVLLLFGIPSVLRCVQMGYDIYN